MISRMFLAALAGALLTLPACTKRNDPPAQPGGGAQSHAAAPTNRVDVPAAVRENLGITFVKAERRRVSSTIRVPGHFELLPSARREYHAPLDGRVELLVQQLQRVDAGTPLYRLDSPSWRGLQRQIADAEGAARRAAAEQESMHILEEAHKRHLAGAQESVRLWTERLEQLEQIRLAGGGRAADRAEAQSALAAAQSQLAEVLEKGAEHDARQVQLKAELDAANAQFELLLASAATLVGVPAAQLVSSESGPALWRTIPAIEIRADASGIVEKLAATTGGWVQERGDVLSTAEPSSVRFRARGLQSDLGRLRDGLPARIVPPSGGSVAPADVVQGTLAIGVTADPDGRTIDLFLTPSQPAVWARAGVSGFLEIEAEGGSAQDLAVPASAVVRDGLTSVIFRRDPKDPDRVIRIAADLGVSDGRLVVVKSGLREGDEVVTDGAYQLMLATSGTAAKGGHFHSDGTFHEGED